MRKYGNNTKNKPKSETIVRSQSPACGATTGGDGDTMIVDKVDSGFLTAKFVHENRLTALTVIGEGEMVSFEREGGKSIQRIALPIDFGNRRNGDPDKWTLNNKSRNAMIDLFGNDTTKWVGKKVEIKLEGSGEYEHITVDTMRTQPS